MTIEKKGLDHFSKQINSLINNQSIIINQIANQIGEYGVNIAKSLIAYQSFEISRTNAKNGEINIFAKDYSERPHIAYVEFGTGYEGKHSKYEGTLPTYWEYYYNSEYKVENLKKWRVGKGKVVSGQVSKGNMWNVSMTLQQDIPKLKYSIKY